MDYAETLLIMEDDLDDTEDLRQFGQSSCQESEQRPEPNDGLSTGESSHDPHPAGSAPSLIGVFVAHVIQRLKKLKKKMLKIEKIH